MSMPVEIKLILFQSMVIIPFLAGFIMKKQIGEPALVSKKIVMINIVVVDPLIVFWSIWGLDLSGDLVFLPLAGIILSVAGFILGNIGNSFIKLKSTAKKTYLISSSLANHGFTMGGFICYLLAGEKGLGHAAIFVSYFLPFVFTVVFPYAGKKESHGIFTISYLKKQFISLKNMPLYAVIAALLFHGAGTARPEHALFPIDLLIFVSVALYYFSLGMTFSAGDLRGAWKEKLSLAAIKFVLLPAGTWLVLNLTSIAPDIKNIILIQSFMPAAIYSVVTSVLYDLDTPLASGLFVVNTITFIAALPVIIFLAFT